MVEAGTDEAGTVEVGTVEVGADEAGPDEAGTDFKRFLGCKPQFDAKRCAAQFRVQLASEHDCAGPSVFDFDVFEFVVDHFVAPCTLAISAMASFDPNVCAVAMSSPHDR